MKYIFTLILISMFSLPLNAQFTDLYQNYDTVLQNISQWISQHPDRLSQQVLGYSQTLNKPIIACKIANNDNAVKKNLLIIGGLNGRDIHTVKTVYNWLLSFTSNQQEINDILNNMNIWLIPTLNPEGYCLAYDNQDFSILTNARERDNITGFSPQSDGVNLNLNFPFNWIHGNNDPGQSFRGNQPLSEIETQTLDSFLSNHKMDFCLILSANSQQNQLIFPYNWYNLRQSSNYLEMNSIANSLKGIAINPAEINLSAVFERNGNISDYLDIRKGVPNVSYSFFSTNFPDNSTFNTLNQNSALFINQTILALQQGYFAQSDQLSILNLKIKNAQNQEPVIAQVVIEERNTLAYKGNFSSDEGYFRKFLLQGEYNFTYYAKGFLSKSETISITPYNNINLETELTPLQPITISGSLTSTDTFYPSQMIVKTNGFEEIIPVTNNQYSFQSFAGEHEFVVWSEGSSPVVQSLYLTSPENHINFNLNDLNILFIDQFEGSCCSWSMNGPWQVVSDNTHNSQFMTDSWSGNGFYEANADYILMASFPINLFGMDEQNVFLTFDYFVHSEWDNDFFKVEFSLNGEDWFSVFKYAGQMDSWKTAFINLQAYKNNDLWMRFRMKDGIANNPNHAGLTDPGVNLDNIKISNGLSTSPVYDNSIPKPELKILEVAPNPINHQSKISFISDQKGKDTTIQIFNIKGQLVREQLLTINDNKNNNFFIQSSDFKSGIYFIRLKSENKVSRSKKIIIIK